MKIVSGGQTGVDRAALDVAIALGVPYGGYVPKGGLAEDHPTPPGVLARYPELVELDTASYARRTIANVRLTDATLIIRPARIVSPGTDLTRHACIESGKPLHTVLIEHDTVPDQEIAGLRSWLASVASSCPHPVINVAGPRASGWPGGYAVTTTLLRALLR